MQAQLESAQVKTFFDQIVSHVKDSTMTIDVVMSGPKLESFTRAMRGMLVPPEPVE